MKALRPVLLALLALASGCAYSNANGYRYDRTFDQAFSVTGVKTVEISSGSGDLRLIPGGNAVKIHGDVRGSSLDAIRAVTFVSRVAGDRLVLSAHEPAHGLTFNASSVYDVAYPARIALVLDTSSGDVRVQEPHEPVTVHSGSGDIKIVSATSDVDAQAASGDVVVALALGWKGSHVTIGTASGDQHLKLPADFFGHLETHTASGSIDNAAGLPESGGGAAVSLQSASGDITISH